MYQRKEVHMERSESWIGKVTHDPLALFGGVGLGAGLMYVLDPERGRRRRSLARDKVIAAMNKAEDALSATAKDVTNRARGVAAAARTRWRNDGAVPDEILIERVRSKLGFVVSHPHAIEVAAQEGSVMLRGPILADEVAGLLVRVEAVPGVRGVENSLEVHEAADIPSLQGGKRRPTYGPRTWSPTTRAAAVLIGGALAMYALRRRTAHDANGTLGLLRSGWSALRS
jgi:hypothetical protein